MQRRTMESLNSPETWTDERFNESSLSEDEVIGTGRIPKADVETLGRRQPSTSSHDEDLSDAQSSGQNDLCISRRVRYLSRTSKP
jgi:hypothetical protein